VDAYLPKPISNEKLAETIGRILTPITGGEVDWKSIAEGVLRVKSVKQKAVKTIDRRLQRGRRKPKQ
jgi:two-component SAPR family response regulator